MDNKNIISFLFILYYTYVIFCIIGYPQEGLLDFTIPLTNLSSALVPELQKNLDLSLEVSKADSFLSRYATNTFIKCVVEQDLESWSDICKKVPTENLKEFFATCKTKLDFIEYQVKIFNTFNEFQKIQKIPMLLDLLCTSSKEMFMYISRLDHNSFPLTLDSYEKSFRDLFAAKDNDEIDYKRQFQNNSISFELTKLKKSLEISMKYNEYAFEYANPETTMISNVLVEDILVWVDTLDTTKDELIHIFFNNSGQRESFLQYLIKTLQIYLKMKNEILPRSLFIILNVFCDDYKDIFRAIQKLYQYKLEELRNSEEGEDSINESSIFYKPKSTLKLLHSVLTDRYFVDLFCYKSHCSNPLVEKIGYYSSWIELTVELEINSILSYDLFQKHLTHIAPKQIAKSTDVVAYCLRCMIDSRDKFLPHNFYFFLFAFSESCEDVYELIQRAEHIYSQRSQEPITMNHGEISHITLLLHSLLSNELMLNLFCQKSPLGCPFTGQIGGNSWLYQVVACGLHSVISTELTVNYVKQNQSEKFDLNKSNAVECISNMIKSKDKFNNEHFYQVVFASANSCQEVYAILNDVTNDKKESFAPNLTSFYSELLSEKYFVEIMMQKSNIKSPFTDYINNRPWLSAVIESQQLSHPILSYLFVNKKRDVCEMINSSGSDSFDIFCALMNLLLDKTDNHRMLRREFFMILTSIKDCNESTSFVKYHSMDTSIVSLKAVQEIKDLFDYTGFQKCKIFAIFSMTFLVGSLSYFLDVGADYSLLYKGFDCLYNNSTIKSMTNDQLNHSSNKTSNFILDKSYNCSFINSMTPSIKDNQFNHSTNFDNSISTCLNNTDFCTFTLGSVSYYFQYTLIVCLMPFLLNTLLVANDIYRNKENSLARLPLSILKHYSIRDKHPYLYHVLCVVQWIVWCPFLILLYPIATKLAYDTNQLHGSDHKQIFNRQKGWKISQER